jgi:hypothetical protein
MDVLTEHYDQTELSNLMHVARVALPPVAEKRSVVPWLFFVFFGLLFFWLLKNDIGFALGILVSVCTVVAALETAYAGMYWCTAAFTAIALVFNPYVRVLPPLAPPIFVLAMVALSPMLLLFVCRKVGPYARRLPDGSRWWLPAARIVIEFVE